MKIYEFSRWFSAKGKIYYVEEREVDEKPKTYVSKYRRFRKDEIGKLDQWGNMILLENDPKTYLLALKKEREKIAEMLQKELEKMKEQIQRIDDELREV